jgi:hypothetical protein
MSHDKAGEINALNTEIKATKKAIERAKDSGAKRELEMKLERLESRLEKLES